jgi:hypothetical protein
VRWPWLPSVIAGRRNHSPGNRRVDIPFFRRRAHWRRGLAELWLSQGHYGGAASFIRRTSDRERLLASERESRGCALMTMYKSTGKEFDGVVLIEGKYRSPSASVTGARFRGIRSARRGNGKEV